jgi:hypothetical protein
VKDEKVATGKMYNLNEDSIEFARLEFPQMKPITLANEVTHGVANDEPAPTAFQVTEMMNPSQPAWATSVISLLTVTFSTVKPNRAGVLTGING